MAAADFVQGALTGYQFVDGQIRQNEYDNQRRMAIQTEDQRYQEGKARQSRLDAENANDRAFTRQRLESMDAIAAEDRQFNRDRLRSQDAFAAQQQALNLQDRDRAERERFRQELKEAAIFEAQRAMAGGSPFSKERHDQLEQEGMGWLSFYHAVEHPETHDSALRLRPILEQHGSGDTSVVNSEEALQIFNDIYGDEIQQGIGEFNSARNARVVEKRIAGFEPGPNGRLAAMIEVTLDNGETYIAPRTRNGSTSPDDPVVLIDPGTAMDDLMGRYRLAVEAEDRREDIENQYRAVYGALPGEQRKEPKLEKVTDAFGNTSFFTWDGENLRAIQPENADSGSAIPRAAVDDLLSDPSPEAVAEFDEVFGEGSARAFIDRSRTGEQRFQFDRSGLDQPAQQPPEQQPSPDQQARSDIPAVNAESLTPEQIDQLRQRVSEVSGARAAGQRVGEDMRFVIDSQGRIVKATAEMLSAPTRYGIRLITGAVKGVGNFLYGIYEGDQQ